MLHSIAVLCSTLPAEHPGYCNVFASSTLLQCSIAQSCSQVLPSIIKHNFTLLQCSIAQSCSQALPSSSSTTPHYSSVLLHKVVHKPCHPHQAQLHITPVFYCTRLYTSLAILIKHNSTLLQCSIAQGCTHALPSSSSTTPHYSSVLLHKVVHMPCHPHQAQLHITPVFYCTRLYTSLAILIKHNSTLLQCSIAQGCTQALPSSSSTTPHYSSVLLHKVVHKPCHPHQAQLHITPVFYCTRLYTSLAILIKHNSTLLQCSIAQGCTHALPSSSSTKKSFLGLKLVVHFLKEEKQFFKINGILKCILYLHFFIF